MDELERLNKKLNQEINATHDNKIRENDRK